MEKKIHARLTPDEVTAIYNKEFDEELDAIITNIRNVARGNTVFANTWKEWFGLGVISGSVIVINTIFPILASFSIIPVFVAAIAASVIAFAGLIGGIVFQRSRIKKNKQRYCEAENFIETEMTQSNIETLRVTMRTELDPVLSVSTPKQINMIVKSVIAAIANLVINHQVANFSDLMKNNFRFNLSASMWKTPIFSMNTRVIQTVINSLPDTRRRDEVVDRICDDQDSSRNDISLTASKLSIFKMRGECHVAETKEHDHEKEEQTNCSGYDANQSRAYG